jgi:hypothetical protein
MISGAALFEPDMDHVDTRPPLYIHGETYRKRVLSFALPGRLALIPDTEAPGGMPGRRSVAGVVLAPEESPRARRYAAGARAWCP